MMRDPEPRIEPPEVEPVLCPVCGAECGTIYLQAITGTPFGCDECLRAEDAREWLRERREAWR